MSQIENHRFQYFCRGVNIATADNRLIDPDLPQFISGVQSFAVNQTTPIIELSDIESNIVTSKKATEITLERVIRKSGDFFIKKNTILANELASNSGKAINFNITSIYGDENEPYLKANKIKALYYFKNYYLSSLSYNLSLTSPSISESLTFAGVNIDNDPNNIPAISVPGAVEYEELFNRSDFRTIYDIVHPSQLPSLVVDLIDHASGNNQKTGLQDITISIALAYSELGDEGTFNLNDPHKFTILSFPILIQTEFSLIKKRGTTNPFLKDLNLSPDTIKINYGDFKFNLGDKNKITSCSIEGSTTDGALEIVKCNYQNFNAFKIEGL